MGVCGVCVHACVSVWCVCKSYVYGIVCGNVKLWLFCMEYVWFAGMYVHVVCVLYLVCEYVCMYILT